MRKIKFFGLMVAASLLLYSCNNETVELGMDPIKDAVNDLESFKLSESGFTIEAIETLDGAFDDMYTQGVLQYSKNGEILALVEFGNGTDANSARLIQNDQVTDIPLDRPIDGPHWDGCFRFVYPLTYIMPDGSEITGNSKQELYLAFREWYEAHPDVLQRPELQFPVEIQLGPEHFAVIHNYQELHRAYQLCDDRPHHDGPCSDGRFIKRVVEPIVRTDECGREPVSGIIKFFNCRTHRWVATIDFGDGRCDDLAVKITEDGETVFVISEWFD